MKTIYSSPVYLSKREDDKVIVIRERGGNILAQLEGPSIAVGLDHEAIMARGMVLVDLLNKAATLGQTKAEEKVVDLPKFLRKVIVQACPPQLREMLKEPTKLGFKDQADMLAAMPPNLRSLVDAVLNFEEPELPPELKQVIDMLTSSGAKVQVRRLDSLEDLVGLSERLGDLVDAAPHPVHSLTVADEYTKDRIQRHMLETGHSYGEQQLDDGSWRVHTCPCGEEELVKQYGQVALAGNFKLAQ